MARGFGLIEVLISMLILSSVILVIAMAQVRALHLNSEALQLTTASQMLSNMTEQLQAGDQQQASWQSELQQSLPGGHGQIKQIGKHDWQVAVSWSVKQGLTAINNCDFAKSDNCLQQTIWL